MEVSDLIDNSTDSNNENATANHDTEAIVDITLQEQGARILLKDYKHVATLYVRYQRMYDSDEEEEDAVRRPTLRRQYSVTAIAIERMFGILGDHGTIRHLVLDNLGEMEGDANCLCRFPLRALTLFLKKAKMLKSLQLDMDTAIAGTAEEGAEFLQVLKDHPTLKVIEIGDFGNGNSTIAASQFSPVKIQKWEELTISHTGNQITTEQVREGILESPYLKKLLIDTSSGGFSRQHLMPLLLSLQENRSGLVELNLLDDFTPQGVEACVAMIRGNNTLQNLFVSLGGLAKYGAMITGALSDNNTLQSLRFVLNSADEPKERNASAKRMVHNLRDNNDLKRIHFHFQGSPNIAESKVEEVFMNAFDEIMPHNLVLEEIRMDRCHGAFELSKDIEFNLSLNRAGRKELLESLESPNQSATRTLWVDKVIDNREDTSVAYYFLCQNPSFLPGAFEAPVLSVERKSRKRKADDQ